MARRTRSDALKTREQILDAAELCYRTKGISNTTLNDIAIKAGFTRGAIYWHFSGQDDLLQAVLDRGHLSISARLEYLSNVKEISLLPELLRCLDNCLKEISSEGRSRNIIEILFHRCDFTGLENVKSTIDLSKEQEKILASLRKIILIAVDNSELKSEADDEIYSFLIYFVLIGCAKTQMIAEKSMYEKAFKVIRYFLR